MTASPIVGRRRPQLPLMFLLVAVHGARIAADDAAECPMNATEPAPAGARLVDGVLWAGSPERPYQPSAYRRVGDGGYVLCACEASKPCVRKCCKRDKLYGDMKDRANSCTKLKDGQAEAIGHFLVPKLVNATGTIGSYEEDQFRLLYGKLPCSNGKTRLNPFESDQDSFRVSKEGWLLNESGFAIAPPGQFCLEQFSDINFKISAVMCLNETQNDETDVKTMFYTVGMVLSLPFFLITFLVYAFIRELRNLHGKSLMCHVSTLLVAYTCLIVNHLTTNKIDSDEFCIILAFIMQFFFLASFFWLNIMCFDLWWTFSRFRAPKGNLIDYESKKFFYYSIYAWGCTLFISIFTYCKQTLPNLFSTLVSPKFGEKKCWFSSKFATMLYFYGPISGLLFVNLLMFIHTAVMILKHMKDTKVLSRRDSQRNINNETQRFVLYLNLFIVMGVNWVTEIVSWALDLEGSVWYLTDIGNALQGVFIFLIFVCKKRVLVLINKKFNMGFRFRNASNTESFRTTNSTISKTYCSKTKNEIEMNSITASKSTNN